MTSNSEPRSRGCPSRRFRWSRTCTRTSWAAPDASRGRPSRVNTSLGGPGPAILSLTTRPGCLCLADPVHGELKIRGECLKFMDTQEFQRLRNLKQLGCTEFVYQTATHTRFEHSIGVAFKASKERSFRVFLWTVVSGARTRPPPPCDAGQVASCLYLMAQMGCEEWVKEFSRRDMNSDVKCVEIAGVLPAVPLWRDFPWGADALFRILAGLCHDLGHGPYSHMFENEFLPKMMGTEAAKQWWAVSPTLPLHFAVTPMRNSTPQFSPPPMHNPQSSWLPPAMPLCFSLCLRTSEARRAAPLPLPRSVITSSPQLRGDELFRSGFVGQVPRGDGCENAGVHGRVKRRPGEFPCH